jgi:hypothetical protein
MFNFFNMAWGSLRLICEAVYEKRKLFHNVSLSQPVFFNGYELRRKSINEMYFSCNFQITDFPLFPVPLGKNVLNKTNLLLIKKRITLWLS